MRTGKRTVLGAAAVLAIGGCGEDGPPTGPIVEGIREFADHREIDMSFQSGDLTLAGTLYFPASGDRFPAVAVNPGSSWTVRSTWEDVGFFVLGLGAAVFSYDRRGAGESEGTCCDSSPDVLFEQFADDLAAAAVALGGSPLIVAGQVGVVGTSLGAWVTPLAANRAPAAISFVFNSVGGAVSTGQERLYDELTGFDVCERSELSIEEINDRLRDAGASGWDPRPSLVALQQPTLWLLGERDFSHPAEFTAEILNDIQAEHPKDWTIEVIPGANHELIADGGICQTTGPLADVFPVIDPWVDRPLER